MRKVLTKRFFERDGKKVALELLGKFLVRRLPRKSASGLRKSASREAAIMINEVEVYDGTKDKASQASRGKTERNAPMFGPAGYAYVYFTYGMHWMLNIVAGKEGYPSAVLIRGAESARGRIDGPAKLTKALKIDKRLNNQPLGKKLGLWIEDRGDVSQNLKFKSAKFKIIRTPRIGVHSAGPIWEKKKLRFVLKKSSIK